MPKVKVYNLSKKGVGEMDLSDSVFDATVNESLLYDVLKAQLASQRKGAASSQTRAEVTATSASSTSRRAPAALVMAPSAHRFSSVAARPMARSPVTSVTGPRARCGSERSRVR